MHSVHDAADINKIYIFTEAVRTAVSNVPSKNKQVAKVLTARDRIAAEHGSFNRIRQVAPVCTTFHKTAHLIFLVMKLVNVDRFSKFFH